MTTKDPVVVTSSHRVTAEKKETFTISANSLLSMAARSRGYLGGDLRKSDEDDSVWQIVYRFDSAEAADAWRAESSRSLWATVLDECAQHLVQRTSGPDRRSRSEPRPAARAASRTESRTGSRTAPGPGPGKPPGPPRWKMAVVTLIAVFPAVLGTNVLVVSQFAGLSLIPRTFVLCVIVTILMTWVLMPRLMKLLGPWLRGNAPVPAPEPVRTEPEREETVRSEPARAATDDKPREAPSDDTIPIPIQLPAPTPPPAMPPPAALPANRPRHRAPAHRARNQPAPSRPGRQVPSGRR
ncbi:antibiotic biosynthesis monooxygenase (ABM) superfamily enzyme [Kibdelosporangium banguiense]|uniref:Antibiotic biosynthesis monooxygenase (ABM) superfamily enzyme n=1 Tax=Kibdelosporangium banguiense TaxID=1365924 RepID=A0ABS4U0C6_9PSEU|nr:antibiotic biosynthesis monooxygenase [Kibdelosporangium banguiense]MBP2329679.1 antibiotic biosynthesis monooxygenase (ABM) superfamily enzyme [Kibdelosporangium banguiense]